MGYIFVLAPVKQMCHGQIRWIVIPNRGGMGTLNPDLIHLRDSCSLFLAGWNEVLMVIAGFNET